MAILKVFSIETGVNDESRVSDFRRYTEMQKAEFDELIESESALDMLVFSVSSGDEVFTGLYNSFEKGEVTKGKKKVDALLKSGHEILDDYMNRIDEAMKSADPSVIELTDELTPKEKQLLLNRLSKDHIQFLTTVKENKNG